LVSSFTNIQVLTGNASDVRAALDAAEITQTKMFARAGVPWVSIYPRATEDGDFALLKAFAFALSKHLSALTLAVMVENSANFRYVLYENGSMIDEYVLHENYPETSKKPFGGSAEALLPHSISGTSKRDLEILLRPKGKETAERNGETMAQALGHFLNIPRAQISMGFNDLKEAQAGR
jgi:hypothetical protein